MKLFQSDDHRPRPVDREHFTGEATMARMDGLAERPRVNLYRVRFEPAARTAWHRHTGHQLLVVVEGRCRLQKDGEPVQEVGPGGAVRVEPGERHWHGATPDGAMTHLAFNVDATTEWQEKVTDAQYRGDT